MTDDFIITVDDLRKCGMCASGVRQWFIAHNLDFKDFLANGMAASKFLDTGDAMGARAVRMVKENKRGR